MKEEDVRKAVQGMLDKLDLEKLIYENFAAREYAGQFIEIKPFAEGEAMEEVDKHRRRWGAWVRLQSAASNLAKEHTGPGDEVHWAKRWAEALADECKDHISAELELMVNNPDPYCKKHTDGK